MANTLAVKITADIVELQTKFAVARAETNALSAEVSKLAKASAAGILDPAGTARLTQAVTEMLQARGAAQGLAGQLSAAGVSANTFGRAMEQSHGSASTLTRELRALFDELSSGRFHQAPGTIAILLQRVAGLSGATLLATGGVLGLAGALAYLTYRAFEAGNTLDSIEMGAKFVGNLDLARDRVKKFADQMALSAQISTSEGLSIAMAIARIPGMTDPAFQAISAGMKDFVAESGIAADKMPEHIGKMFNPLTSAAQFAKNDIKGVTQPMIDLATEADRSGNANQQLAAKITIWSEALALGSAKVDEHNAKMTSSFGTFMKYAGLATANNAAAEAGLVPQEAANTLLEETNALREKSNALMQQGLLFQSATPATKDQIMQTGLEVASKENPVAKQVAEAQVNIDKMEASLKAVQATGNQANINLLVGGIEKAKADLATLTLGPLVARMNEQMAEVAAKWDGTQSGMLAAQIDIGNKMLAQVGSNAKEGVEIERQISHLRVELKKAASAEIIEQARLESTQLAGDMTQSAAGRLAAERDLWAQVIANDKVQGAARITANQELATKNTELVKQQSADTLAIARADANSQIAIARLNIGAQKQILDEQVAAGQISAEAKLATLRLMTAQEFSISLQEKEAELATVANSPGEYQKVYDQILEMKARLGLDMATLDRQYAADAAKAARDEATSWKSAVAEIERSETTMIASVLSDRKSFAQAAYSLAGSMIEKELQNDVKAMTTRMLLDKTEAVQKQALEQGGFLYHALAEAQKTGATTAGVTARTTAENSTGIFTLIGRTVASWFGGEAAKTGATVVGTGTRTVAETAANIAATAESKITAMGEILDYAAVGAAAAGASVAAIPIYGWAMAGPTAAATFVDLSAYTAALSFDRGAWEIPGTMQGTLHQGEQVIPKDYATGLRESAAKSGAAAGGGGDGHQVHMNYNIQAMDGASVKAMLLQHAPTIAAAMQTHLKRVGFLTPMY